MNSHCRFTKDVNIDDYTVIQPSNGNNNSNGIITRGGMIKTKIDPVIVAPIADINFWRVNDMVVPAQINSETNIDVSRSGYIKPIKKQKHRENPTKMERIVVPRDEFIKVTNLQPNIFTNNLPQPIISNLGIEVATQFGNYNYEKNDQTDSIYIREVQPPREKEKDRSEEKQEETRKIEEKKEEKNEEMKEKEIEYFSHISNYFPSLNESDFSRGEERCNSVELTYDTVYDPRLTGYGSAYRAYMDKNQGNTKYYYDDVNYARMNPFIYRSKIDFIPSSDEMDHEDIDRNFIELTNFQRVDMSERLMRKVNSEKWQQKIAPLNKSGFYMAGARRL